MKNVDKIVAGMLVALVTMVACGSPERTVQNVESDTIAPTVVERKSYDSYGKVVFHEYVPTQAKAQTYHDYKVPYTTWTPTVIIECKGMRKRLEDQTSYEMYYIGENLLTIITDGYDSDGNVIECDFEIKGEVE